MVGGWFEHPTQGFIIKPNPVPYYYLRIGVYRAMTRYLKQYHFRKSILHQKHVLTVDSTYGMSEVYEKDK